MQELELEALLKVLETDSKVIVDLYTGWCQPCKIMAPMLEAAASRFPKIKFYKVNLEDCPDAVGYFDVRSVPTIIFFDSGQETSRKEGTMSKAELESWIANGFAS